MSPHLLLSAFAVPHSGSSLWLPSFFAVCTISIFMCWGHKLSHSFIFAVSFPFLYRHLQSLPRAPLSAVFFSFSLRRKPCRVLILHAPPSCCSKLTYVRAVLCCKVLICRRLSICPHSPSNFYKVLTTITQQKQQPSLQTNTTAFGYKVLFVTF